MEFTITGTTLAYERVGSGSTVLFVHGSASDMRTWEPQMPAFSARHDTIRMSRRFHRPNAEIGSDEAYLMSQHVDDLIEVLEQLGGGVHLVGHSYGAVTAMVVASRRPDLVRSLVLEEPPAFNLFASDPPKPLEVVKLFRRNRKLAIAFLRFGATVVGPSTKATKKGDLEAAGRIFSQGVLGKAKYASMSAARLNQAAENSPPQERLTDKFVRLDPANVAKISCPTLLISGEDSPDMLRLLAEEVAGIIPGAVHRRVADASHIVHEDQPDVFTQTVMDFLASVDT